MTAAFKMRPETSTSNCRNACSERDMETAPQRGNKRIVRHPLSEPFLTDNQQQKIHPSATAGGGLDKGLFMLYICSLNRSFYR